MSPQKVSSTIYQSISKKTPHNISHGKKVYVAMSADFIHHGHLNILKTASQYGKVTVGLLTDKAIASYKRVPILKYDQRLEIVENLKQVSEVIPQDTLDYVPNLEKIKPNYVVHGDDWKTGIQKETRKRVIKTIRQWGGKLIEPKYTEDISSTKIISKITENGVTPSHRLKKLKELINLKPIVRVIEAHNGLTGLIAEKTKITKNGKIHEFDAMWESSLTDSTSKGKPDTSAVDVSSRIATINQILEVTTKPMIVDADNGGLVEHFIFTVKSLERLGVSAVIIEDKIGPKRNSLFGTDITQEQDSIEEFCYKITQGKRALVTDDFMIIARIESLILKKGLYDALKRAESYINAGADGIMIHSKENQPDEILEFCRHYRSFENRKPLVVVPSTYSQVTEDELIEAGVNIVIYANQLLRSAYKAMSETANNILKYERAKEADEACQPIKEIINLITLPPID